MMNHATKIFIVSLFFSTTFSFMVKADGTAAVGTDKKVPTVPEKLEGVEILTVESLDKILKEEKALPADKKKTVVIDVRKPLEYVEEHIMGALTIPYKEESKKEVKYDVSLDSFDLASVEKRAEPNVVYYCNGHECWKSFKACKWSLKNKLKKKIYWLRDGMPEWKKKGFATAVGK